MSTDLDKPGGKDAMAAMLRETKSLVDEGARDEAAEQMELLDPLSAEELADAQDDLGKEAKPLAVLRHARETRKGRAPGTRNRRTDDMVRYLSQFGPDPAVAMMTIMRDSEEAMVERSTAIDPYKRRMTYGEARAIRVRCAETMIPYFHGKQPVQADVRITGIRIEETIGRLPDVNATGAIIDGIVGVVRPNGEDDDA